MDIQFENVTKLYGPVIGVNDVVCTVTAGVTGLLGANGAGKSTLIKLASGQLQPTQGRVLLGGQKAWGAASKRLLGYSSDVNSFYEEMTGREFVYTMTRLYGYSRREARDRTEKTLVDVGMEQAQNGAWLAAVTACGSASSWGQALTHDPPILLLDEPLTGIDPGGRREINDLLRRLAAQGKTILVSTHLLHELEGLADSIIMIAHGRILASGSVSDVRQWLGDPDANEEAGAGQKSGRSRRAQPWLVEIGCDDPRKLCAAAVHLPGVIGVEIASDHLVARTTDAAQFFAALGGKVAAGEVELHSLEVLDSGADAVFGYLQQVGS